MPPPNRAEPCSDSRNPTQPTRSEEHTSELQSQSNLVCRLLLEKKKKKHPPQRFRSAHESIEKPATPPLQYPHTLSARRRKRSTYRNAAYLHADRLECAILVTSH